MACSCVLWCSVIVLMLGHGVHVVLADEDADGIPTRPPPRKVLVFGGNGFMGASTVEKFIRNKDNVTMVNRGNWYWDSFNRIQPYVDHISCDRKNDLDSCEEVVQLFERTDSFDVVVDFSGYSEKETKQACELLKDKAKLYILISTDSVYDVCEKNHDEFIKETDSIRPQDEEEQKRLAFHHEYGHKKLLAEEAVIAQKSGDNSGIPYIILRLPDVIGPRDSTWRWWIYQLWVKLESHLTHKPVTIPPYLEEFNMSFVYSEDIAKLIFDLVDHDSDVHDEVFNIAYPETFTIQDLLTAIRKELDLPTDKEIGIEHNQTNTVFVYPSVRSGPLDVSKAQDKLDWMPTPWEDAVLHTIQFYEDAMKGEKYNTQKDEIIQIVSHHLYYDNKMEMYEHLEKLYDTNLHHFKPREEL